jgi:hypothetical protein
MSGPQIGSSENSGIRQHKDDREDLSSGWERRTNYPPPRGAVLNAAGSDGEDG